MVSYKPTFTLNPLTNINIYLSPHATSPTLNVPFHIAMHFAFDAYAPTMTLQQRCKELMDYLVNRGYEPSFLKTQIRRASDISRDAALKPKPKQQTDTVPFVITYNPALPNISRIIHKHSNVLYSSGRCKNVCTNLPLVAYRRCKNISDILVRN